MGKIGLIIGIILVVLALLVGLLAYGYGMEKAEGLCKGIKKPIMDMLLMGNIQDSFDKLCNLYGNTGTGSTAYSCSGTSGGINVPNADMQWVKGAADAWLGGDQAALIAIIQVESSWSSSIGNSKSSATGLGQFIDSTAESMKEFVGGQDGKTGIAWPAGKIDGSQNDARLDPKRSIYATADYVSNGGKGNSKCDALSGAEKAGCLYLYNHNRGCSNYDETKVDIKKVCPKTSSPTDECKCIAGVIAKNSVIDFYNKVSTGCSRANIVEGLPSNAICSTEKAGKVVYSYKYQGTNYDIKEETVKMLNLVPIDMKKVDTGKEQLYVNSDVAKALEAASQQPLCKKCFRVTLAYRTCAQQSDICHSLCGQDSCPAPKNCATPGVSNHNKGIAIDVVGNPGNDCGNSGQSHCAMTIVNALEGTNVLKHFNECLTKSSDGKYEEGNDCVHFSLTGK